MSDCTKTVNCPICNRSFENTEIEEHVNKCLFLNSCEKSNSKRQGQQLLSPNEKRKKVEKLTALPPNLKSSQSQKISTNENIKIPLSESLRPKSLDQIVGQKQSFGTDSMLRSMLEQNKIPNMILWGPPGCGKTSLANVISNICKKQNNLKFVKLSATTSGINDVKEIVKIAKNDAQFKNQTILFMDEIHRFNKLQQDTFLPHVENGTITLIGATTENPSFSLNNALLSRCRVVVMDKLTTEDVMVILKKAIEYNEAKLINTKETVNKSDEPNQTIPRYLIEEASLQWLAEMCDGDARVALSALELALNARDPGSDVHLNGPAVLTHDDIKDGIKRSHVVYDKHGEEHYNTISAIQKCIRAGDDNAALYWTARAMHGGEDPLYIARRFVRMACEDIGLADQSALVEAVACFQGCHQIGMPECDVLLAQCAVRLARAPKSREVYNALKRCQQSLKETKGPLPPVPLHLRNAPTKLMKQIGYGSGYNLLSKEESGLTYLPAGVEGDYFQKEYEGD